MYQPLNEGKLSIDTVFALAAGAANAATSKKPDDGVYSSSSIAQEASKLVAVFPVLASRTVSPDTAQMVSKYIEQKACNLFMLALQSANISNAKSGVEYLQNFHKNLDLGGDSINAVISVMNNWIDAFNTGKALKESATDEEVEASFNYSDLVECDRDLEISSRDMKQLLEVMKENANIVFYDTKLNPMSINDYVVREFEDGNYHVSIGNMEAFQEAKTSKKNSNGLRDSGRQEAINAADRDIDSAGVNRSDSNYADQWNDRYQYHRELQKQIQDDKDAQDKYNQDKRDEQSKRDREKQDRVYDAKKRKRDWDEHRADRADKRAKERQEAEARGRSGKNVTILKDQDIKKMNDAVPSLLVVKFYSSSTASVATEFIIGVKSKLIPITTTEVLRRIMNDNKDGKKFLNFMRAITGELKATEVIFGLSRVKDDVLSTKAKGAYGNVWNLLANRAEAARSAIKQGKHNDFSAITTVLISQNDADELFREENFDISNPGNALHFMKSYNLIAFAIADDATETLKIMMDDGEKIFSEYAYRMLERETEDGTYKKLINLMAASK